METANGPTADNASQGTIPASFVEDPVAYLSSIADRPPSLLALDQLGGWVSIWVAGKARDHVENGTLIASSVAAAYLKAAATHLQEAVLPTGNLQLEAVTTKKQYEVVKTVGVCATLCKNHRGAISSSGILPVLANLLLNSPMQHVNSLSLVGVEFLQCALLAEQYRYAARLVGGTWPRPDMTVNVKLVLRYYYLRGMIHLGCNDFVMAHRCFWTCLSVPADVACKIAVEAWKKLVLVQCIMFDGNHADANQITLPRSMPTCLTRIVVSSKESSTGKKVPTTFPSFAPRMGANEPTLGQMESTVCDCYADIATAFYERDKTTFEALMTEHKVKVQVDGNWGLLEQCRTQLINNQVRHISRMYSIISMAKLATLLGIASTSGDTTNQQVALLLYRSGVQCEIQDDGMIVFHGAHEESTGTSSSLVDLAEWMGLVERVQKLDVNIWTSPKYQSLTRKEIPTSGPTGSGGASDEAKIAATGGSRAPRGVDDM